MLLAIPLIIGGCSKKLSDITWNFLDRDKLEIREVDFDYFSGKAKINYKDDEYDVKAKANIRIIKHLNRFLPFKTLNQMYISLVRSHLDYCDVIYHIPPILHQPPLGMTLHNLMEKIQYQAGLAVVGAWQGTSRVKLYENLGWETLSD